jgi:hypothetical protein
VVVHSGLVNLDRVEQPGRFSNSGCGKRLCRQWLCQVKYTTCSGDFSTEAHTVGTWSFLASAPATCTWTLACGVASEFFGERDAQGYLGYVPGD